MRAQNLVFQLFQLGGNVALTIGQGLLAGIVVGNHVFVAVADLDVIAKHMVEADFQLGNTGFLPQAGFQLSQNPLGVLPDGPQFIHFVVVARSNDAAILEGGGGFRVDGRINAGLDVLQGVHFSGQSFQLLAAAVPCQLFQLGQTVKGLGHRVDFLGGGGAIHRPGHQALNIGDIAQGLGQLTPGHGLFHQALHRVEAVVDDGAGYQRLFQPAAQQALAHGGGSLIQNPQQGPPLLPAPHGLGELQIGAGHVGQVHVLGLGVADHRLEAADALNLGVVQVLQQSAHGVFHQAVGADLSGVGPVPAKLFGQGGLDEAGSVPLILHQFHRAVEIFFDVVGDFPIGENALVHQHLTGMIAAQLRNDRQPQLVAGQLSDVGCAGGDIRKADARLLPFQVEAGDVVVAVILQHAALDDSARRHHADDIPLDQALGGGRVLHLFADGHLIALGNQPGHIGLIAVEGHAAHGGTLLLAALLAGKGQIQLPGSRDGVVVEHLIEIADAIKEDLILMLFFDIQILFHHGRQIRHGIPLLSPDASRIPPSGLFPVTIETRKRGSADAQPR